MGSKHSRELCLIAHTFLPLHSMLKGKLSMMSMLVYKMLRCLTLALLLSFSQSSPVARERGDISAVEKSIPRYQLANG
jgi:hypothetical protein